MAWRKDGSTAWRTPELESVAGRWFMQVTRAGKVLAWVLASTLAGVNAAGYTLNLYEHYWWFDRVLHGATIFAISVWLALIVFAPALSANRRVLTFLLIASVGLAVGALWEVAEWGFDLIVAGDVIKGKYDTVLDIIMDTAGSAVGAFLSLAFFRAPGETRLAAD